MNKCKQRFQHKKMGKHWRHDLEKMGAKLWLSSSGRTVLVTPITTFTDNGWFSFLISVEFLCLSVGFFPELKLLQQTSTILEAPLVSKYWCSPSHSSVLLDFLLGVQFLIASTVSMLFVVGWALPCFRLTIFIQMFLLEGLSDLPVPGLSCCLLGLWDVIWYMGYLWFSPLSLIIWQWASQAWPSASWDWDFWRWLFDFDLSLAFCRGGACKWR